LRGVAAVLMGGVLAMSADGFKKQAVALNAAQAGTLILGATSRAGERSSRRWPSPRRQACACT
jgi:hypothetical protein